MTDRLTNAEILEVLRGDTPLARAVSVFHSAYAEIDTGAHQRSPISTLEMRQIEIDAVKKIAEILGVKLEG